jgi:probable F420-dependent oxidoreductase
MSAERLAVVEAARQALGEVGVVFPVTFTSLPAVPVQQESARALEKAGYGGTWVNEVIGGKDALVQLGMLLAATERMVFGTGIANIWARQPQLAHGAAAMLAQAYPGRVVLGLGVGYPQQAEATGREFGNPVTTMRRYLSTMDEQMWPPAVAAAYPRIVAALGPKMRALAAESADGVLPAGLPPEGTARTREEIGPDKLLVMGMTVVPDQDAARAREGAREYVRSLLGMPGQAGRLARLGFTEREIDEVDNRLVEALVAFGDGEAIAGRVRAHLAAGADHVVLMVPPGGDFETGVAQLVSIAPAVTKAG